MLPDDGSSLIRNMLEHRPPSTTCCDSTYPVRSLSLPLAQPLSHHNPFRYKYTARPIPVILHPPIHEFGTDKGSETSAIRTKTPGNYPKENILHNEQGESLKSRIRNAVQFVKTTCMEITTWNRVILEKYEFLSGSMYFSYFVPVLIVIINAVA